MLVLLAGHGSALAQASGSAADQPARGAQVREEAGMVLIPASQARDIQRATHEVSDCVRLQDDGRRLACYDEVAARRLPQQDRDITTSAPATDWGLKGSRSMSGGTLVQPPGSSRTHPQAPGGPASPGMALPDMEQVDSGPAGGENDSSQGKLLLDGRHVSQAVQDVRRALGADLADRWELDDDANRGRFLLRPYKPVYFSFADWTNSLNRQPHSLNPLNTVPLELSSQSNQARRTEVKFQISFKTKIAENLFGHNGDIWVGYTQMSLWQIYSQRLSRPFRETNYEPELMAVFRTNYRLGGWHGRLASFSLNHQSNGRPLPLSRSWNRLILQIGLERDRWTLLLRPWWRVPEDPADDDNPDITDYYGRGEAVAIYRRGGHEWALTLRHSLRVGHAHGSIGLDHAFPISSYLKAHIQFFHGYGASLIDYNHRQTRIGIGVSLVQWL